MSTPLMSGLENQEGSIFSGNLQGSIETGLLGDSYFSPAPRPSEPRAGTSDETSKKAVLLCTDGSGLALPNCKFIADELARQLECDVWIPDYFLGEWSLNIIGEIARAHASKLTTHITVFRETSHSSQLSVFA